MKFNKIQDLPKNPDWKNVEEVKAIQDFLRRELDKQFNAINLEDIGRRQKKK